MTTTAPPSRATHPPVRLAAGSGVTTACSVGGLALMGAGQGIGGWALIMLGVAVTVGMQLSLRTTDDVRPRGTRVGRAGTVVALVVLVVVAALGARATVVAHPWLAASIALASGAAAAGLLRWWQVRPGADGL
ncbi:hypothetical protein [Cellulomonas xiejunii]|uniref:hypothetical protein n=1 Tax=Cellulomonas xiejunii TaxID=2968083 RepID=UPI001D0E57D6|nr:hypothetical protein [Cellulomonas xiejunii]MCC2315383.1 hypothetical protein [Cellulomonas xiejunii]